MLNQRFLKILMICSILVGFVLLFLLIYDNMLIKQEVQTLYDENSKYIEELKEVQSLEEKNMILEKYMNTDEFIENYARKNLGFVKKGEIIFK